MRAASKISSQLIAWFQTAQRDLPWRRTRDPYAIWVSEIMLQQTQVKTVIPYWERWMRELPSLRALAEASPAHVLKLWEGLGYYSRARNLHAAARQIVAKDSAEFPRTLDEILALPGVGRYTAGAIASIAFGMPAPIVDGNVARVLCRLLGLRGDPKSKETSHRLWSAAQALVEAAHSSGACSELNQGLMELGATVCLPRAPLCLQCPIKADCFAFKNCCVDKLPEIPARPKTTARVFRAILCVRNGKALLRQRPLGSINGGFWELPNIEAGREASEATLGAIAGPAPNPQLLCVIRHTITRFRMTLEVYRAPKSANVPGGKWFKVNDLNTIPLVSAHRKALLAAGVLSSPA